MFFWYFVRTLLNMSKIHPPTPDSVGQAWPIPPRLQGGGDNYGMRSIWSKKRLMNSLDGPRSTTFPPKRKNPAGEFNGWTQEHRISVKKLKIC